jgi:DNA-binding beta-propeller fold protein YncE
MNRPHEELAVEVGEGGHRYRAVADWLQVPEGSTLIEVVAVACDSQGRVYVFNRGSDPLMIFEPTGQFIRSVACGNFRRPHGITLGADGSIFCVDDFDHTVKQFASDGRPLMTLGTSGQYSDTGAVTLDYRTIRRAGPPFNYPTNLAVGPNGDWYVTDGYGNARVHRFAADGRLRDSWGEPGSGPGQFQVPHGIAVSRDGIVYIADRENSRIQRFTLEGAYLDQWCDVVRPCEVFVTDQGTVFVAELGLQAGRWPHWPPPPASAPGGRVSVFDAEGNRLARWGGGKNPCAPGDFFAPHDIWVDCFGDLYVAEVVWSAGANKGLVSAACHTLQKFVHLSP